MSDVDEITEEQRMRLLVHSVTDYAIYMLDPNGRVTTWNPGAERFKGYKADEIIGQNFSRFFTPEDRAEDRPARALRIAAREGKFEAEGWRVRKDGTRFWAHVVLDPVRTEEGHLIGFAKITRDITEKREQLSALHESEQRFRLLVQGVRDYAIYMIDPNGIVSNWNSGAEAIKGYSADEIVGQHFSRFYTEEDRAAGEPRRALQIALREGKYEREALRVRKDGSLFWAHVVIDPIFDESGKHIGFAKITRDVSDRKKAQDELEAARNLVGQSQRLQALGELTGGIAHDFNNLMTVIGGSADFLLRHPDLPQEKRTQYLKAISDTVGRATDLTSHLLAFGRRQPIKPRVVDPNLRLDALSEMLVRTLGSRVDVKLVLSATGNIEVDEAQFETAILNAAFNARDAMPDGGRLTIASRDEERDGQPYIRVCVGDTGEGMSAEVRERAFEPFFTTKDVGKGTGLGLSQIHGFAAQAGGISEIESSPGEGTIISISLPRSGQATRFRSEAACDRRIPEGLKLLVVEDNPKVQQFACDLLRDLGCDVRSADTGNEALEMLKDNEFDLVMSDIVMPGMSGLELARLVGASPSPVPVVLATGYSSELLEGQHHFPVIAKPYGVDDVVEAIAKVVQKPE